MSESEREREIKKERESVSHAMFRLQKAAYVHVHTQGDNSQPAIERQQQALREREHIQRDRQQLQRDRAMAGVRGCKQSFLCCLCLVCSQMRME